MNMMESEKGSKANQGPFINSIYQQYFSNRWLLEFFSYQERKFHVNILPTKNVYLYKKEFYYSTHTPKDKPGTSVWPEPQMP